MDMLNELRTLITLVAFVTFIGIIFWAWSGRRKTAFTEASRIPLDDDDVPSVPGVQTESGVERSAK
jgi:cytochrome c oxidase cbb3-type subunit 4